MLRRSASVALLAVLAVFLMNAAKAWAGILIYTDKTAWEDAVGGKVKGQDGTRW